MLVGNQLFISPEIDRLIKDIIRDDARYSTELRSVHRERLVCPVTVKLDDSEEEIHAFSRNISSAGICLISQKPVDQRASATLEIYRLKDTASEIIAECRWCKPFGEHYFMSGWQFTRLPRKRRK